MKIILAGVTGYIGTEVLSQCLANPGITSIVALSRRKVDISNSKLYVYIMKDEDYLCYSDAALIERLKGARAFIWALGLRPSQASNDDHSRRVSVDYMVAAASAFQNAFVSGPHFSPASGDRFRFVYFSGGGVERDQQKTLWFMGNFRRLRGEVENVLLRHAEANCDVFEPYILRPGLVLSRERTLKDRFWSLAPSVKVDILAKGAIDVTFNGHKQDTIANQTLKEGAEC